MRIDFHGKLDNEPRIRAGFIGCGSHSFRNVYPTFQFAPVDLVATCDLDIEKARAFAKQFGAEGAYADYRDMLEKEKLDAVFVVTGYNDRGRPLYPKIAGDCLRAGVHAWIEKPPAASCADIEFLQQAAEAGGVHGMCGLKKMFFPANRKAKELMARADFGRTSMALVQYPQAIPSAEEFAVYKEGNSGPVRSFLDHLCHPMALIIYLFGMPDALYYQRSHSGSGSAIFSYDDGKVVTLAFTYGQARNGGLERTTIVSEKGHHILVDNNIRVQYCRTGSMAQGTGYGSAPDYFTGTPEETTATWEPEFSLGQLYNKGLFLLGYYDEVNEFARAILEKRAPQNGTLAQAWQVTRVFEAFFEGPGRNISLK